MPARGTSPAHCGPGSMASRSYPGLGESGGLGTPLPPLPGMGGKLPQPGGGGPGSGRRREAVPTYSLDDLLAPEDTVSDLERATMKGPAKSGRREGRAARQQRPQRFGHRFAVGQRRRQLPARRRGPPVRTNNAASRRRRARRRKKIRSR